MSIVGEDIYIHNVYIKPTCYSVKDIPPILYSLKRLLEYKGGHIILGDFNLYYLLWNSPTYNKHHYIANELLNIISEIGAILYTLKGLALRDY